MNIFAQLILKSKVYIAGLLKYLLSMLAPQNVNHVVVFPQITDSAEATDIYWKLSYYCPRDTEIEMYVGFDVTIGAIPEYLSAIEPNLSIKPLVKKIGLAGLIKSMLQGKAIAVADVEAENSKYAFILGTYVFKIDRHHHQWVSWEYINLYNHLVQEPPTANDAKLFKEFIKALPDYKKSYVFGTGPSLGLFDKYDFSDGFRIVCNTIVKSEDVINTIQPHLIVAADGLYHFSCTTYAYQFRKDLSRRLRDTEMCLLIPDMFKGVFCREYPDIKHKVIGIPIQVKPNEISNMRLMEEFRLSPVGNVLNLVLLPLSSSLSNVIYFLGFDGRAPDSKMFWNHNLSTQYNDLMDDLVKSDPAFFDLTNYESYSSQQSEDADMIMTYGESLGKTYTSLVKSYNPAFTSRSKELINI